MVKWSWHLQETTWSKSASTTPASSNLELLIADFRVPGATTGSEPARSPARPVILCTSAVEHLVEARTFCLDARLHYFVDFQEFVSWHLIQSYSTAPPGRRTRWTAETGWRFSSSQAAQPGLTVLSGQYFRAAQLFWSTSSHQRNKEEGNGWTLQMIPFGFPGFRQCHKCPEADPMACDCADSDPDRRTGCTKTGHGSAWLEQSLGPCAWSCRLPAARNGQGFLCGSRDQPLSCFVDWWQSSLLYLTAHWSDFIPKTSGDSPKSSQQLQQSDGWSDSCSSSWARPSSPLPPPQSTDAPVPHWFTSFGRIPCCTHAKQAVLRS